MYPPGHANDSKKRHQQSKRRSTPSSKQYKQTTITPNALKSERKKITRTLYCSCRCRGRLWFSPSYNDPVPIVSYHLLSALKLIYSGDQDLQPKIYPQFPIPPISFCAFYQLPYLLNFHSQNPCEERQRISLKAFHKIDHIIPPNLLSPTISFPRT